MKSTIRVWLTLLGWASCMAVAQAQVTVQGSGDVVGSGADAWSFLKLEGENYAEEVNDAVGVGFTRADENGLFTSFLGQPILAEDTTASNKGVLWTQSAFGVHIDQVKYQVQFDKPGTYFLYMRFTMFENGGNLAHYINEDSFFVPPDFNADPQNGWPLLASNGHNGGYTEGCCDGGYLTIRENGVLVNHRDGGEAGQAFWEGNFHWNELSSSQFLNPETQGAPAVRHKYVVTEEQVGQTLDWSVSYREGGTAIDMWLFSTEENLMTLYTQEELDELLLGATPTLPCDLNKDGAVDAADAGIMFGDWGGPGSTSPADKNKDGFVDAADAGIMFEDWTGDPSVPADKAATAEYNPETGELRISSAGAVNVFVQSASNSITPVSPAPTVPVGLLTNNSGRVGITNLGPIQVTNFSFGNIGKGLALSDLKLVYTTALGTKGIEVPASTADGAAFKYIPEPASLGLIGLGLAGLLAYRRRCQ